MALAAFVPVLGSIVDKLLGLIPDANARARAEAEYQTALLAAVVRESADNREINKTEAAHGSVFVSGWRPFIGWICGLAVAFQYLVRPFWIWAAAVWFPDVPAPPGLDGMLWN
jgi:hypothetical protein